MFSISSRPTIREIHILYRQSKATPTQVTQFFLNRIKEKDSEINGFVNVIADFGLAQASMLDKELSESKNIDELLMSKPLFGIPFGIKDIVQIEGQVFTAASDILKGFKAPYSSTVYQKLEKAGAIAVGVCNMDSHAMGASGENSDYGPSRNPFDTSRTCGGSSCGSVAVVASGQVVFSIGTDTGGSIRQPSAFTDLVGIKPTYGLVSRWGIAPMASSLDQAAPISNSVEDNLNILAIIAGEDSKDQISINSSELITKIQALSNKINDKIEENRNSTKLSKTSNPLTIGVIKEFMSDFINPQITKALQDMLAKLESIGHKIEYISLPIVNDAIGLYYISMAVEVSSNLQRIDGVRYAKQPFVNGENSDKIEEMYFDHRRNYFPDEATRRIILGGYTSSSENFKKYYEQSQKVKSMAIDEFQKAFQKVDLIFAPVVPEFPFKIGQKNTDPIQMYLCDVFTCIFNPIKVPAISVPLGLFDVVDEEVILVFDDSGLLSSKTITNSRHRSVAIINVEGTNDFVTFQKTSKIEGDEFYDSKAFFLAGGMVEAGENSLDGVRREVLEEIGIMNMRLVRNLGKVSKVIEYKGQVQENLEEYFLFTITKEQLANRTNCEIDNQKWKVVTASIGDLKSNNWNQLNYILDNMLAQKEPKTVKLPTGCQLVGPELSEDRIYTLALEIEQLKNNSND